MAAACHRAAARWYTEWTGAAPQPRRQGRRPHGPASAIATNRISSSGRGGSDRFSLDQRPCSVFPGRHRTAVNCNLNCNPFAGPGLVVIYALRVRQAGPHKSTPWIDLGLTVSWPWLLLAVKGFPGASRGAHSTRPRLPCQNSGLSRRAAGKSGYDSARGCAGRHWGSDARVLLGSVAARRGQQQDRADTRKCRWKAGVAGTWGDSACRLLRFRADRSLASRQWAAVTVTWGGLKWN